MKKQLTKGQLSIWTGQKLHENAPVHNTAYTFDIAGPINVPLFKKAFQELVNHSDAFRIVIVEENGLPYQQVLPDLNFDIELVDFSEDQSPDGIQSWIENRSQNKFNLYESVFDSVLIKVSEEQFIWFLNMHHIVTDVISFAIIQKRMSLLYGNAIDGVSQEIERWPQFLDTIHQDSLSLEDDKESTTYWENKINSIDGYPVLYGKENKGISTKAKRFSINLGSERSQKLKKLAQHPVARSWTSHLSLFNILSSALFIYLKRVGNQSKIAIGAPFQGRSSKSEKETIGYFIKIFPLVMELNDEDTFETVIQRNKLEINEYLINSQKGSLTEGISKSFNIVFNYIHADFPSFNDFQTTVDWVHPNHIDPNHQMRCHVLDFNSTGELQILFDLNSGVFSDALAQEVPQHFLRLLDALLIDIEQPIGSPGLVVEKKLSDIKFNHDDPSKGILTIERFHNIVVQNPDAVAIEFQDTEYTYGKLNEEANKLSHLLNNQGFKKEAIIGVHLQRTPDYLISILAILKIGAVFIPLPSDYPQERINKIITDSASSCIISSLALAENLKEIQVRKLILDDYIQELSEMPVINPSISIRKDNTAYAIYTSGSTGIPKGVLISHGALDNYISWAEAFYEIDAKSVFPLFTSIGFDLTITSTFLPLFTGGKVIIYKESNTGPDISLMQVLDDNKVNSIKLTPSHLALIQNYDNSTSRIRTMIVGGEDFKTKLARTIQDSFGRGLRIFNEYGPTETTVGCIASEFDFETQDGTSVPIGLPIRNTEAYILDAFGNTVPDGVVGSLFIAGAGLSKGYLNKPELTAEKFSKGLKDSNVLLYQTGDLARTNEYGYFEFLGREDEQVKLKGFRIELPEIEANLVQYKNIDNTAVVVADGEGSEPSTKVKNCMECGLPSNFPNADFDDKDVCHLCNAFKSYKDKAQRYFKTKDELRNILLSKRGENPNYDCISLLSGGKDSTYILAQLVDMGLKVLAFTLDNGYISEQAKGNISKIVTKLGVDHVYGKTAHMNKIFVDSLQRHHNVCDGCFKTIYTLSTQIALEKQIPFIVTGLSRGQFFETRLTEELFWDENADVSTIDDTILEARKLYHQEDDAVKKHLDVSMFDYEDTFQKVQFLDFYRYSDVSLSEMLKFLEEKVGWVRPTDTGRSTNCLINQLGIYVHKKERGYSNYSFPYSWDVRMGHKTRTETLDEINEVIDENEVKQMMKEIGYTESTESELEQSRLVAYYTGKKKLSSTELVNHLKKKLPEYMIPSYFKYIDELPLTTNGKVDKNALKALNHSQLEMETPFVAPEGEIEELLASIWKEVLRLKQVGVHDDFIALGGHSLAAIRVTARINEEVEMKFPLNKIFELPTISEYAKYIEQTLIAQLED